MADSERSRSPTSGLKRKASSPVAESTSLPPKQHADQAPPSPEAVVDVSNPPLPDEEAPPLPDEQPPPLANESAPPLPDEAPPGLSNAAPPLPDEPAPGQEPQNPQTAEEDDGWQPIWDDTHSAFYFYNRFTQAMQWENPRVTVEHAPGTAPRTLSTGAPGTAAPGTSVNGTTEEVHPAVAGGYNPAIHGSYDPNASYAQIHPSTSSPPPGPTHLGAPPGLPSDPAAQADDYATTGTFNRFTGRFQAPSISTENHTDEAKSKRQMAAFFDVDRAANSHDGRSLKAERSGKRLSKRELREFQTKRREKKEEKRRAWLRD